MNFRTLLPGTFKGNIRIRKLWLHHNPLRWVEQNLTVCLIIFHHIQHFYKCIMVFKKKSIMFTFVNAPHSIFFSLAIPPLKTGPKQNDALNLATLDQIKKMEERRHNHRQHHHYQRHSTITIIITIISIINIITINVKIPSPGQFKTLPSQP